MIKLIAAETSSTGYIRRFTAHGPEEQTGQIMGDNLWKFYPEIQRSRWREFIHTSTSGFNYMCRETPNLQDGKSFLRYCQQYAIWFWLRFCQWVLRYLFVLSLTVTSVLISKFTIFPTPFEKQASTVRFSGKVKFCKGVVKPFDQEVWLITTGSRFSAIY